MDLALTPAQLELQARARAFVVDVLQPLEVDFERSGGRLDPAVERDLKRRAIAANLHGGSFPAKLGGQGWRRSTRCSSTSSSARSRAACGG